MMKLWIQYLFHINYFVDGLGKYIFFQCGLIIKPKHKASDSPGFWL